MFAKGSFEGVLDKILRPDAGICSSGCWVMRAGSQAAVIESRCFFCFFIYNSISDSWSWLNVTYSVE